MLASQFGRVEELFHAALALPPGRRGNFLIQKCAGDPELLREARRLLDHHGEDEFLTPPAQALAHSPDESLSHPLIGRRIGGYAVLRLVGAGGQGLVFEARQESLGRRVALKLISAATLPTALERRLFEREVRTLARLQHPGIAAIHESGQSDEGQPFFAMEFVDGRPLTDFARQRELPPRERVQLFLHVCEAVSYAHQKGVIHRDIKPANILVSESAGTEEESAEPKVLDFGLARFLDGDAGPRTETGRIQGTLPYLSPEQARGDSARIDARSDVYSLGVVLYELLAGRLPLDVDQDRPGDALRRICEERPSRLGPVRFDRDLEAIVLKALEKEPPRRYQSAAALAEDLRRYLDREPVLARMPSATYQLRKLAARHKLPVALASALLISLAVFALFATVQAWRLAEQRDAAWKASQKAVAESLRTRGEAQRATRVARFLETVLVESDPRSRGDSRSDPDGPVAMAAKRLDVDLRDDAPTAAKLRVVLGRASARIGRLPDADAFLSQAVCDLREMYGEDHADVIDAQISLADLRRTQHDLDDAQSILSQAQASAARLGGMSSDMSRTLADALFQVALQRGDLDAAEGLYPDPAGNPADLTCCPLLNQAHVLCRLGEIRAARGDFAKAEKLLRDALRIRRVLLTDRHPWTAQAREAFAEMELRRGDGIEAERHLRRALAALNQLADAPVEQTIRLRLALARAAELQDHPGEAEATLSRALEVATRALPAWSPLRLECHARDGACLADCGESAAAQTHLLVSYHELRALLGDEHPDVQAALGRLEERSEDGAPGVVRR